MNENVPLWKMALEAAPDSFGLIPANFSFDLPEKEYSEGAKHKIAQNTAKKEKPQFCYTSVKTQYCVDSVLSFSESLATAYFRNSENGGEKVFLQGNSFLAKLAKAVFEKNENLFVEACETHKDENYFLKCAEALEEQGFTLKRGNQINREPWLALFNITLQLTEEYLATKCDLPKIKAFECEDNSENSTDLKIIFAPQNTTEKELEEASLSPLQSVPCSSDFLVISSTFFDFLSRNFPCQNSESELKEFLNKFYYENICENLGWLYRAIKSNSLPMPETFRTGIMETNKFGAYKDRHIYISHRLALDSLRNQKSCFVLFLSMLHEYGHFLDDVLHERAGISGDSEGEEGKIFASRFMEYSAANLFNSNFKFADLIAPNPKGEDQKFSLEISNLSFEGRKEIMSIFEFDENSEVGSLKLPTGETIDNVEFSKLTNFENALYQTHQTLTMKGAQIANIRYNSFLTDGSIWPDFPTKSYLETNIPYSLYVLFRGRDHRENQLVYESHYGKNQHWHSMCPKLAEIPTNKKVAEMILEQAEKWYSEAITKKKENKTKESLFALGKLCHMVQDSFVLAHCWRRYVGDENFIPLQRINDDYHGKIWTFQDYMAQDGNMHAYSDSPERDRVQTIGYKSAEEASGEILKRYKKELEWNERYSALTPLKECIGKIYELCEGRENLPSGGSHPWFEKNTGFSTEKVKKFLTRFSMEVTEC